jgi:hypothetical protein
VAQPASRAAVAATEKPAANKGRIAALALMSDFLIVYLHFESVNVKFAHPMEGNFAISWKLQEVKVMPTSNVLNEMAREFFILSSIVD